MNSASACGEVSVSPLDMRGIIVRPRGIIAGKPQEVHE
jgi:hypothetical protein